MTANNETTNKDLYTGYIASVVLALVTSGWLADGMVYPVSGFLSEVSFSHLQESLAAGLFFAIAIGDPVSTLVDRSSARRMLVRFGGGFFFGILANLLILAPLAGAGMSTFLQLILVVLYIPFRAMAVIVSDVFADRATGPSDRLASALLYVARWPDRFLFVMFMSISFVAFWSYAPTLQTTLIVLVVWLTLLTTAIASRTYTEEKISVKEADFQAWLALDSEGSTAEKPMTRAMEEMGKIIRVVVPGAVLLGGMTCFAVQALVSFYPDIAANLADPDQMLHAIGIIAVSILAIVFGGMLTGLVFGLILLQITATLRHWSVSHHRENCFHLLRAMRFRPIQRSS